MTRITGRAGKAVATYIIVLVRQAVRIVVLMAVDAAKGLEIARRSVAFRALIPFALVFSTEDGEIQLIVLGKIARIPARFDGMASLAIGWEIARLMVWTCSSPKIGFVTGKTVRRRVGKIPAYMTPIAIVDQMPARQRKKQMVSGPCHPLPIRQGKVMTLRTIRGIPGGLMIGRSGGLICVEMTIHT